MHGDIPETDARKLEQRENEDQRTLGELFFFLVDERADIIFSRSLGIQRADPFNMPFSDI